MPSRRRNAFTLVELLVVLGIIVVLVSILLPVLKGVREQSKSVTCSGNIHEILVAMSAYASASDGALPLAPTAMNTYRPPNDPLSQSLAYYMLSAPGSASPVIDYRDGKFWRYLGSSNAQATAKPSTQDRNDGCPDYRERLFTCPSDDARAQGRNFSYSWNFNTRFAWKDGSTRPGVDRLPIIIEPAHKIVLEEEEKPTDGVGHLCDRNSTANPPPAPTSRHLKRGNYGFADGHVEWVSSQQEFRKMLQQAQAPRQDK